MRVDHGGVDHLAGLVDHRDLHAGAHAGVQPHGGARSGGSGEQQILQIAREHLDGVDLGAGAQRAHQFEFQMHEALHAPGEAHRVHQPAVGGAVPVLDAEAAGDARLTGVVRRAPGRPLFFAVEAQPHVEHVLAPPAEQRQRAVRREGAERFRIVEVVGVFFRCRFLALAQPGFDDAVCLHVFAQGLQQARILGETLHQDLTRAVERGLDVGYAGIVALFGGEGLAQIAGCCLVRIQRRVRQQGIRQRLQPGLLRDLHLAAPLRLERQIEVFQLRLVRRQREGLQQLGRHLVLPGDRFDDGRAARFQFAQVAQPLFQQAQLRIIQPARRLLAVARDERHRRPRVEQGNGGGHLRGVGRDLGGEPVFDGRKHGSIRDRPRDGAADRGTIRSRHYAKPDDSA